MKKRKYNRLQKIREDEQKKEEARRQAEKLKKQNRFRIWVLVLAAAGMLGLAYGLHYINQRNAEPPVEEPDEVAAETVEEVEEEPDEEPKPSAYREGSLNAQLREYAESENISMDDFAYYIENLETGDVYQHNAKTNFTAASTYKMPLAMLWLDKVADGEVTLETELTYDAISYEPGGPLSYNYHPGDKINLKTIIDDTILYSDNTGGHIMFDHLGGWEGYKKMVTRYCDIPQEPEFFTDDNYYNAEFMSAVLKELYYHPKKYELLLEDMKLAEPERYLNSSVHELAAQKYGSLNEYQNAVGIVYDGHPYTIAVYTKLGGYGSHHIGEMNRIVYEYFNK